MNGGRAIVRIAQQERTTSQNTVIHGSNPPNHPTLNQRRQSFKPKPSPWGRGIILIVILIPWPVCGQLVPTTSIFILSPPRAAP